MWLCQFGFRNEDILSKYLIKFFQNTKTKKSPKKLKYSIIGY